MVTITKLNSRETKSYPLNFDFGYAFGLAFSMIYFLLINLEYPLYKNIYFYLKSLINNIRIIPLESDLVMFYLSSIFILFIMTVILIPINLIYSHLTKEIFIFNTRYNIEIILYFTIFGIVITIYLFFLNNLRYQNIFYLIDTYLIVMYIFITLLIVFTAVYGIGFYVNDPKKYVLRKCLKEKDVKIRTEIMKTLASGIFFSPFTLLLPILFGIIPWFSIIFFGFNLFIILEIFRKKYFLDSDTFYQDLSELRRYFNKRLLILFGLLAFIALFDTTKEVLLDNYTIQPKLEPLIVIGEEMFNYIFAVFLPLASFLNFLIYLNYYFIYHYLNYYLHYYILPENIDYKVDEKYYIKNIQVDPIVTFLSYLALFIVFIVNLSL
jgi:hypothetical protein